jgi:hypothetical protein
MAEPRYVYFVRHGYIFSIERYRVVRETSRTYVVMIRGGELRQWKQSSGHDSFEDRSAAEAYYERMVGEQIGKLEDKLSRLRSLLARPIPVTEIDPKPAPAIPLILE